MSWFTKPVCGELITFWARLLKNSYRWARKMYILATFNAYSNHFYFSYKIGKISQVSVLEFHKVNADSGSVLRSEFTWQRLIFRVWYALLYLENLTKSCVINQDTYHYLTAYYRYSETSIYRSQKIRFPGSVVQFLWSLSESYFNYGSRIYCFPGSIVSFSDPQQKR
jgi:hypothetical protein